MSIETGTLGTALADGIGLLRASGSPSPRLDAEVLLAHALGRNRSWILAHPEAKLGADVGERYAAMLERRGTGEPVAYIRGFKEWHSLRIRTDARALIPRPETELLADAAIGDITDRLTRDHGGPIVAWEVATGSGAVAVALALRFRSAVLLGRLRLIASDISPDALALAAENLAAHDVADLVEVIEADLLDPAGGSLPRPDVVVANLPYVASAEVDQRQGSLGFEPRIAVDGGPDGLTVLRRLFAELAERTAPAATVLLEIGVGQAPAVAGLAGPSAQVSFVPDLAGIDRVVRVELA
jgi:release factor glutamine methyltransferase